MTELKDVKGVGPKSLSLLNKINIYSVEDLVTHYPFRYDVIKRSNIEELIQDDKIIIDILSDECYTHADKVRVGCDLVETDEATNKLIRKRIKSTDLYSENLEIGKIV